MIIRAAIPRRVRQRLFERAKRLNLTTPPRAPLSDGTRQQLNELFRPEIVRLGQLLERDLGHWLQSSERDQRALDGAGGS